MLETLTWKPAVPYIGRDQLGSPYLVGSRCTDCGAIAPGLRKICNACGNRLSVLPTTLGLRGTLYSFTIVHRSFPGVKTPFVAAIVELEGGGAIKGTVLDIDPNPEAVAFDMPLDIVFRETGQFAEDGAPFLSYYFSPPGASPQ